MNQLLQAARAQAAKAGVLNRAGADSETCSATKLSGPASPEPVRIAKFRAIEAVRKTYRISIDKLASAADIASSWYRRCVKEPFRATDRVIGALTVALRHLKEGKTHDESALTMLVEAVYGGFLAAICPQLGLRIEDVRANNPRAGRTADPKWLKEARARQLAVYLTNVATSVPQRLIARVIGVTPAAVCLALKTIEDLRDDPVFDTIIESSARTVTGRSA